LRLSFSRSLCQHICDQVDGASVQSVKVRVGRELSPGESSESGLYAICKRKTGWPLRVTLFGELADHWRHESRRVHECRVEFEKPVRDD
jgi:hypothetical protein